MAENLSALFAGLARDWDGEEYRFSIEAGGRTLTLCLPLRERGGLAERGFLRVPEPPEPDARLRFRTDDCARFLGPEAFSQRWRRREEGGWVVSAPGRWFLAADLSRRTFYHCLHGPEGRGPLPGWPLRALISQWAVAAGLLPVHGGAVGVGGRGVLLAARSGGGKSTLAASCLAAGMDFVADDYVLAGAEGPLRAMPAVSTLKLTPDMRDRLGLSLPALEEGPDGKLTLDASALPLCRELDLTAVVFLSRWDREGAEIAPASGSAALRLAQSALRTEGAYDPRTARAVVARLSRLPAYEMRLGRRLEQNAEALRQWIERMD